MGSSPTTGTKNARGAVIPGHGRPRPRTGAEPPGGIRARLTEDFGGAGTGQAGVGTITNASAFFMFTGASSSKAVAVYQNTAAIASRATPITTRTLTGLYVIGREGTGTFDEYWRGDIAEMLVYNREWSAGALNQVWQFLARKHLPELLPLRITAVARLEEGQVRLTGHRAASVNLHRAWQHRSHDDQLALPWVG